VSCWTNSGVLTSSSYHLSHVGIANLRDKVDSESKQLLANDSKIHYLGLGLERPSCISFSFFDLFPWVDFFGFVLFSRFSAVTGSWRAHGHGGGGMRYYAPSRCLLTQKLCS